jgi:hypothetical protein
MPGTTRMNTILPELLLVLGAATVVAAQEPPPAGDPPKPKTELHDLDHYGISIFGGFGRLTDSDHLTKTLGVRYELTSVSNPPRWLPRPNIWAAYGLDRIEAGTAQVEGEVSSNPYLAGLGIGFGSLADNTSAISLDVGCGFWEGQDWSENKDFFLGVSIDGRLLVQVIKSLASVEFK